MRKCLVKRCAALVTALVLFAAPIHPAAGSDNGHWAEKTLSAWAERGWLKGDGTGNLRPDDEVTRAEFASMINRAFGLPPASVFPVFSDLPETDWAYADIQAAVAHGYMKGYGKSLAGPHRRITREEAAVMIARLLGLDGCTVDLAYKDRDKIGWSASAVTAVSRAGILNGFPDGTFRPWHIMTRAEAVVSIDRALAFSKATGLSAIPEGNLGFFIGTQTTADVDGNFTLKDVTLHFFRPGTEKLDRIPLQYVKEANGDWHVGVENVDYRIAACDESGLTSIPIKPPVYGNTGTDLTINLDYVFRGKMKFRVVLTPSESGRRTIAA